MLPPRTAIGRNRRCPSSTASASTASAAAAQCPTAAYSLGQGHAFLPESAEACCAGSCTVYPSRLPAGAISKGTRDSFAVAMETSHVALSAGHHKSLQALQSQRDSGTSGIRPPTRGATGLLVYDGPSLSAKRPGCRNHEVPMPHLGRNPVREPFLMRASATRRGQVDDTDIVVRGMKGS